MVISGIISCYVKPNGGENEQKENLGGRQYRIRLCFSGLFPKYSSRYEGSQDDKGRAQVALGFVLLACRRQG